MTGGRTGYRIRLKLWYSCFAAEKQWPRECLQHSGTVAPAELPDDADSIIHADRLFPPAMAVFLLPFAGGRSRTQRLVVDAVRTPLSLLPLVR